MKNKTITSLVLGGFLILSGFIVTGEMAYAAQNAPLYAPGQMYNFTFRLQGLERHIRTQADLQLLLQDLIEYLRELKEAAQAIEDAVVVQTRSATNITDDTAVLRGLADMNDLHNGRVFFVYGEAEDLVEAAASDDEKYDDIDEFEDELRKVIVDADLDASNSYNEKVRNLDNDTTYYFNLCVDYEEDDNDVITCGSLHKFTTRS